MILLRWSDSACRFSRRGVEMKMVQILALCYRPCLLFSSWYASHWFYYLNGVGDKSHHVYFLGNWLPIKGISEPVFIWFTYLFANEMKYTLTHKLILPASKWVILSTNTTNSRVPGKSWLLIGEPANFSCFKDQWMLIMDDNIDTTYG